MKYHVPQYKINNSDLLTGTASIAEILAVTAAAATAAAVGIGAGKLGICNVFGGVTA